MFILVSVTALYALLIIYSFNLLPYKWLCDYNTDMRYCPKQRHLSITSCFVPIFLYTSSIVFFLLRIPQSTLEVATTLVMILLLSHISLSDILYMIIPDQHVLLIFFISLLNLTADNLSFKLLGLLAGALPFVVLLIAGILLKNKECIGFGDIKLMSVLGFLLGYANILNLYIISCLLSGTFLMILTIKNTLIKQNSKSNFVPFAPFISFSYIFCIM